MSEVSKVTVLPAYAAEGDADVMVGALLICSIVEELVALLDGGFENTATAPQLPALNDAATEQLSVTTAHTAAVGCLQFCSCGRKPEPVIDIVALAYVRPGLVGAKYRILGRADQDINAVA